MGLDANDPGLGSTGGAGQVPMDTPLWWLIRLALLLNQRDARLQRYRDYYEGRHKLAFADQKFREHFGELFGTYAENICELVVDATSERLRVNGFRMGASKDLGADDDTWAIWQANQLDGEAQLAHKTMLIEGESYAGVWVNPKDAQHPLIRILDPRSTIVVPDYEDKLKRRAALRRWRDEWTGHTFATLYLPDATFKYEARGSLPVTPPVEPEIAERIQYGMLTGWQRRKVANEPWPLPNPLGVVPIIPFLNKPTIGHNGMSELVSAIPINDAINKLVSDMLLAAASGAYRQKWGINIPMTEDEATGKIKIPFEMDVDKFLALGPTPPGEPKPEFGQFDETSLDPYVKAIEQRLQMAATITRTPHHYILGGQGSFPSGEALRAVEAPLVSKVTDKMQFTGESWEEVIRTAWLVLGDARGKIMDSETLWRDPENRTESQHVDALVKMAALGVPEEILWEKWGATPTEIARWKQIIKDTKAAEPPPPPPLDPSAIPFGAMPGGLPNGAAAIGGPVIPGGPTGAPGLKTTEASVKV